MVIWMTPPAAVTRNLDAEEIASRLEATESDLGDNVHGGSDQNSGARCARAVVRHDSVRHKQFRVDISEIHDSAKLAAAAGANEVSDHALLDVKRCALSEINADRRHVVAVDVEAS
ncbi:MAG: hypothetical protein JO366_11810 [Methylobacteriaceae bacterium]|nr:hypothetical protein [Methylobacteriaceae bacterium]MBV9245485.1 hypothetical protein [Methylobacteriaceae bacterium]